MSTACSEAPVKNLSKASVKFLAALGPHAKLPAEMSIFPTLGAPPRRKCQSLRLSGALLTANAPYVASSLSGKPTFWKPSLCVELAIHLRVSGHLISNLDTFLFLLDTSRSSILRSATRLLLIKSDRVSPAPASPVRCCPCRRRTPRASGGRRRQGCISPIYL